MTTKFSASQLQSLGTKLKRLREAKGVSAAEIATAVLGYKEGSHVAVTRLERGILVTPRPDHLKLLASYFEVPIEDLLPKNFDWAGYAGASEAGARQKDTSAATKCKPRTTTVAPKKLQEKPQAKPSSAKTKAPGTLEARIRYLREQEALGPLEYAQALCKHGALITTSDVVAWETGDRTPNPLQIAAIARHGHVSENWVKEGKESVVPGPAFGFHFPRAPDKVALA